MRMTPLVPTRIIDSFVHGRGMLTALALGFVPVARSRGREIDKAEAVRGLTELPWHPFAFHGTLDLGWEITNSEKLRGTFDDGTTKAVVEFDVDGEGRVLRACASSCPSIVGKSLSETAWSGSFGEYRMFDRLRLPATAEVTCHLPHGPFSYWRVRIANFRILQ